MIQRDIVFTFNKSILYIHYGKCSVYKTTDVDRNFSLDIFS